MEKTVLITAILLNNPAAHLVHDLPYKKMDWQSSPRITIEAKNLQIGSSELEVEVRDSGDKQVYSFKDSFESKDGTHAIEKILAAPLKDPAYFLVKLKSGEEELTNKLQIELA